MTYVVGQKGQIVISKEIRDRLGVGPGWVALQRIADDHLEVYFVPPEHTKSLKGSLAPYIKKTVPASEWDRARREAWEEAAKDREEAENT